MRQIRRGVFETNSSSTHSVSIRKNGDDKFCFLYDEDDGYVHSGFGEFGWEVCSYPDQKDKLSYLLTMARIKTGCEPTWNSKETDKQALKRFLNTEEFKKINDVVAARVGCKGVWIDEIDGYIDHQSHEDYDTLQDFLDDYGLDIEAFIFHNGVVLHTDNDNH